MKAIPHILMLCFMLTCVTVASAGVSLEEAVNQVKSEGRVLSAKTVNGRHEIKVLTPSGTVKTINKVAKSRNVSTDNNNRPEYYNRNGHSMRDRKSNQAIPNRFQPQNNDRRRNNRQMDLQPMMLDKRNKNSQKNKSNNKNKDK